MKIPKSVNELTVNQFVRLEKIKKADIPEADRTDKVVELFTGLTPEQTDELPMWRAKILFEDAITLLRSEPKLKRKKVIWLKGKRYVACKGEHDLSKAEGMALYEFQKDVYGNMHKILALVYKPWRVKHTIKTSKGEKNYYLTARFNADLHSKSCEDFHHAKVKDVFGQFFFYSTKLDTWNLISRASLIIAEQEVMETMEGVKEVLRDLGVNTDGTISQIRSRAEIHLKKMNSTNGQ